jgi:hypothetical protein
MHPRARPCRNPASGDDEHLERCRILADAGSHEIVRTHRDEAGSTEHNLRCGNCRAERPAASAGLVLTWFLADAAVIFSHFIGLAE